MKILMQKKEVIRNETFDEEISALITFVKPQIYSSLLCKNLDSPIISLYFSLENWN